jgi:hypothetical protein
MQTFAQDADGNRYTVDYPIHSRFLKTRNALEEAFGREYLDYDDQLTMQKFAQFCADKEKRISGGELHSQDLPEINIYSPPLYTKRLHVSFYESAEEEEEEEEEEEGA